MKCSLMLIFILYTLFTLCSGKIDLIDQFDSEKVSEVEISPVYLLYSGEPNPMGSLSNGCYSCSKCTHGCQDCGSVTYCCCGSRDNVCCKKSGCTGTRCYESYCGVCYGYDDDSSHPNRQAESGSTVAGLAVIIPIIIGVLVALGFAGYRLYIWNRQRNQFQAPIHPEPVTYQNLHQQPQPGYPTPVTYQSLPQGQQYLQVPQQQQGFPGYVSYPAQGVQLMPQYGNSPYPQPGVAYAQPVTAYPVEGQQYATTSLPMGQPYSHHP